MWQTGPLAVATVVVTAALLYGGLRRFFRTVRVEISSAGLTHVGLVRRRRWDWDRVGTLVVVERLRVSRLSPAAYDWLIVLDPAGRRLFTVTAGAWSQAARQALIDRFPRVDRMGGEWTPADVHARHPGALTVVQRHPFGAGIGLAVAITAVTAVVAYVAAG